MLHLRGGTRTGIANWPHALPRCDARPTDLPTTALEDSPQASKFPSLSTGKLASTKLDAANLGADVVVPDTKSDPHSTRDGPSPTPSVAEPTSWMSLRRIEAPVGDAPTDAESRHRRSTIWKSLAQWIAMF